MGAGASGGRGATTGPSQSPPPQPRHSAPGPRAPADPALLLWARPIFTPCCPESEAALVLRQEGNLILLRDGRSTGGERGKCPLWQPGQWPRGTLLHSSSPAILHSVWQKEPLRGPQGRYGSLETGLPTGLCDLGGQLGLSVLITCLQGSWAKVCIINMLGAACPSPTLAVVSIACQHRAEGGLQGTGASCTVTSIHPSLAPGREWELVLQSGQA